jgi:glutathione S-transferase
MIASRVDQIEARLAQQGPWMTGERFSALDPYAFMLCRWTRGMTRPACTLPHVGAFLQRMLARPALQKVIATEQWAEPLV